MPRLILALLCFFVSICTLQSEQINDEDFNAAYNLCTQDKQAQACLLLSTQGLESLESCESSCNEIGLIYHNASSALEGEALTNYIKIAVAYYTKAALQGNILSVYNIGMMFYEAQMYDKAKEYFDTACKKGFARACNNLGVLYRSGFGVAQDLTKAKSLYAQACESKEPLGCHNLGFMYAFGIGVSQNFALAQSYFGKACNLGHTQSCEINANRLQREDLQKFESLNNNDKGFEI